MDVSARIFRFPRTLEPELMDDPRLAETDLRAALCSLRKLNALSFTGTQIAAHLLKETSGLSELRILDLGCGDGSLLCDLLRRLRKAGKVCDGAGYDINPKSIAYALEQAEPNCSFVTMDVLSKEPLGEFDIVISSLFFHHLERADCINLLKKIRAARPKLICISDLSRSRSAQVFTWLATRTFSRSPIVHYDGPQSVRAAFTAREFIELTQAAGLPKGRMWRQFPFRFLYSARLQ